MIARPQNDFYQMDYEDTGNFDDNGFGGLPAPIDQTPVLDQSFIPQPIQPIQPQAPVESGGGLPAPDPTPAPTPTAPAKPNYIDALSKQILGQGTTDRWSGQGYGSAEANARNMAEILSGIGITDINQFGKLPDGSFGNKVTGQAVPNTYSERQKGDFWGGTFQGKGNTGYGVQFDQQGNPLFYTQGASSSDIGKLAPLLAIAQFIPGLQPFAMAANAAIAASQGNALGAIGGLAGLGGFGDVASAANFANAVKSGNPLGIISSGANLGGTDLSGVANAVGAGDLNNIGGYNVNDIAKAYQAAKAIKSGDPASIISSLGGYVANQGDQTPASPLDSLTPIPSDRSDTFSSLEEPRERTIATKPVESSIGEPPTDIPSIGAPNPFEILPELPKYTNGARDYSGGSFDDAFAKARANGDKTFIWNGKPFTTELKSTASPLNSGPMSGRTINTGAGMDPSALAGWGGSNVDPNFIKSAAPNLGWDPSTYFPKVDIKMASPTGALGNVPEYDYKKNQQSYLNISPSLTGMAEKYNNPGLPADVLSHELAHVGTKLASKPEEDASKLYLRMANQAGMSINDVYNRPSDVTIFNNNLNNSIDYINKTYGTNAGTYLGNPQAPLFEKMADLAAIQMQTGKDLTADPVLQKTLFSDPKAVAMYNAMTIPRMTRLDAKDLPTGTVTTSDFPKGQVPLEFRIKNLIRGGKSAGGSVAGYAAGGTTNQMIEDADSQDQQELLAARKPVTQTQTPTTDATPTNAQMKAEIISKIKDQILGQGLTSKWSGEGYGSAEKNAEDMAKIMAGIGITDIKQFGKIPQYETRTQYQGQDVNYDEDGNPYIMGSGGGLDDYGNPMPTRQSVDPSKLEQVKVQVGETFGNKENGQVVPNTYSERQTGNFFGGTFAGKGNTGYGVQFDAQGNPYFYTQGASSNDLANIMKDLGPLGQIGLAIATGGLSIPEQIAAQMAVQVLSGKDIGDAIKGAAISYAGAQIPGLDAIKEGASFLNGIDSTGALSKAFQNAAISGARAALTGQDIGKALETGAITGGVNGIVNAVLSTDDFKDLSASQKKIATNAITGVISGKPLDQILINSAIAAANASVSTSKSTDDTSPLSAEEQAKLIENRLNKAIAGSQESDEERDARTQEIIKQLEQENQVGGLPTTPQEGTSHLGTVTPVEKQADDTVDVAGTRSIKPIEPLELPVDSGLSSVKPLEFKIPTKPAGSDEVVITSKKKIEEPPTDPLELISSPLSQATSFTIPNKANGPEMVVTAKRKEDEQIPVEPLVYPVEGSNSATNMIPNLVITANRPPDEAPTGIDPITGAPLSTAVPTASSPTTSTASATGTSGTSTSGTSGGLKYASNPLDSSAQFLKAAPTKKELAKLASLQQLFNSLTPEMQAVLTDRGLSPPSEEFKSDLPSELTAEPLTTFAATGGSIFGDAAKIIDSMNPTYVKSTTHLAAAPVIDQPTRFQMLKHLAEGPLKGSGMRGGLSHGGLPEKYAKAAPAGHKPEFITGLTGYYAQGGGTGQSDDIPAMLHDGDYVMDADTVAALGDGSSKAGAEVLEKMRNSVPQSRSHGGSPVPAQIADGEYVFPASFVTAIGGGSNSLGAKRLNEMREKIRAHKRSAPTTKIPPKAKSPLDYLKMAKG